MRRLYTLIDYGASLVIKGVEKSPWFIKWPILIPILTIVLFAALVADSGDKGSGDVV